MDGKLHWCSSLIHLCLMEFPAPINWTNPFRIWGLMGRYIYNFKSTSCKQTMQNLITCRALWHLIWFCTILPVSLKMKARLIWVNPRELTNINALKNNVWSLLLHKFNSIQYSPNFIKHILLYFVPISLSIGCWTFSIIFVFQCKATYKSESAVIKYSG